MRSVNERTEMSTTESAEKPVRVRVVDAVRGLAVVFMIQWHCADGWLGGAIREEETFAWLRVVGGLAAPLFLSLAGVSLGLTFRASTIGASVRRALTIVVMGYALKLVAWAFDYGAALETNNWAAITLDAATLALAWRALGEGRSSRERLALSAGAAACAFATWFALNGTTCSPDVILRVDVLQGIGAALVLTALTMALAVRTRWPAVVMASAGVLVALATPSLVGADFSVLPTRLADYLARTSIDGMPSGARFPLFPWAAYALTGAAMGLAARARPSYDAWALPRMPRPAIVLVLSVLVAWSIYEPHPFAQSILAHGEQPRNLIRLAFNTTIALALAAASSLVLPRLRAVADTVLLLGRHSLIVYAVHLELAYGLVAIPIDQRMGYAAWSVGVAIVIGLMIALARALDAHEARTRAPRPQARLARA